MDATNCFGPGQIGERAADAQHAVVAARREAHRVGGLREQLAAGLVGRRDRLEQLAVGLGIGADAVVIGIAFRLDPARGGDARGDVGWA